MLHAGKRFTAQLKTQRSGMCVRLYNCDPYIHCGQSQLHIHVQESRFLLFDNTYTHNGSHQVKKQNIHLQFEWFLIIHIKST